MSFITKRHVPRRTFLQGAGVTLALPLIEAMVPASTLLAQTAAQPKTRFVGVFFPHGMAPGLWEPAQEGIALRDENHAWITVDPDEPELPTAHRCLHQGFEQAVDAADRFPACIVRSGDRRAQARQKSR